MRQRSFGGTMAAVLGIALGTWGCGEGTVAADAADSGQPSTESRNPQPHPVEDSGSVAPPLPATLSGQVTLLGAASNAGADVTIAQSNAAPTQAVTDANGSYFVDDLAAGDFTVTFSAAGYQSQTKTGTVAAGDSAQVSVSLERSRLIAALAEAPPVGAYVGHAPAIALADGGQAPSSQLFYLDPSLLLSLQTEGDAGGDVLATDDGGLRLLGFDREGGAVLKRTSSAGIEVDFADQGAISSLWLGDGVTGTVSIGDDVYFATPAAKGESDWSAMGAGDLGPTPIAQNISTAISPVVLADGMAGWVLGSDGYATPVAFGPERSDPLDAVCTQLAPPITASLDGQRYAFAVVPRHLTTITVAPPPPGPDACLASSTPQVFIAGHNVLQLTDLTLANARVGIYPLTDTSYAGTIVDGGGLHLFVHAAAKVSSSAGADGGAAWTSEWESDIAGWAPLAGPNLLAADRVDGGLALEAIGPAAIAGALSASASIPFAHEWSAPLAVSADNRYVVLTGIGALFDLKKQIEIPLIVTPLSVQFDRSETTALLLDSTGQMAVLPLGGDLGAGPQGLRLEGTGVAVSFTPTEEGVVYAGTDAFGNTGIFVQPIPAAGSAGSP